MYKPVIAQPCYRPRKAGVYGVDQACIVVAAFQDMTANLLTFNMDGEVTFVKKAVMVQATDGCVAHYTDPEPELKPTNKLTGGGSTATIVVRTICWFDGDVAEQDQLVGWQQVNILVPDGSTFDDYNVNGCTVSLVDGPRFTGAGGKPITPPVNPLLGPFNAISGATLPWWWTVGLAILPPGQPITIYKDSTGVTQPYMY